MKPNLKLAQRHPYERVKAIPEGTPITLDGKSGVMLSMTGHRITVKVGRKNLFLQAGDPRLERISAHANTTKVP
jgi:hypothetical protein